MNTRDLCKKMAKLVGHVESIREVRKYTEYFKDDGWLVDTIQPSLDIAYPDYTINKSKAKEASEYIKEFIQDPDKDKDELEEFTDNMMDIFLELF